MLRLSRVWSRFVATAMQASGHMARSFERSRNRLPHGMHVLRLDLVEHALFAGLRERIFVLP